MQYLTYFNLTCYEISSLLCVYVLFMSYFMLCSSFWISEPLVPHFHIIYGHKMAAITTTTCKGNCTCAKATDWRPEGHIFCTCSINKVPILQ
ncbi:hypothetical protein GDO81_025268 [Engystomops pustulosus]|uniref:Uncharacterized protein n=1 Tax=Engystomops pustulosus TaxID=76066 RepID=A0AAV6ZSJ2_ENGPU|nr:hypothetical protein GDO81_025268 [Engystomops pustulosus]